MRELPATARDSMVVGSPYPVELMFRMGVIAYEREVDEETKKRLELSGWRVLDGGPHEPNSKDEGLQPA